MTNRAVAATFGLPHTPLHDLATPVGGGLNDRSAGDSTQARSIAASVSFSDLILEETHPMETMTMTATIDGHDHDHDHEHSHEHDHEVEEALEEALELDTQSQIFLEMRRQNLELAEDRHRGRRLHRRAWAAQAGDLRNALRNIWEVFSEFYTWVDPEEAEGRR